MIRRFVLFAAVFLFALPYAHADEASKRVKIEEMFTVLKMDSMMKQMMNQGLAQGKEVAKSMMGGAPMTAADQKIMDDYMAKVFAVVGLGDAITSAGCLRMGGVYDLFNCHGSSSFRDSLRLDARQRDSFLAL